MKISKPTINCLRFSLHICLLDVWMLFLGTKLDERGNSRKVISKLFISYQGKKCTCAYQGVKKCSFFGKFGVLCFLEIPVLRFALLPYYRRILGQL